MVAVKSGFWKERQKIIKDKIKQNKIELTENQISVPPSIRHWSKRGIS